MNPASIPAAVLTAISLVLLVVAMRRGPPYGRAVDWIAAALMALAVAAMWWLRDRVDLVIYPFGAFCFVMGYYLGARALASGRVSRSRAT